MRLLAARFDLHVFYPEAVYPSVLRPASAQPFALDRNWRPPDVKVTYIPYSAIPFLSRPLNGFTMARSIFPHVRRFQPDVIFNYTAYPDGLAAVRIARSLQIPSVLTAIGSDLNRVTDPIRRVLTRQTLSRADIVTTVSKDLADTALSLGASAKTTFAIHNGCDTTVFHPNNRAEARAALQIPEGAEAIVYVGRLDLRKGLEELLSATADLRARRPSVHTYLVGDGPDREKLVSLAKQFGLDESGQDCLTLVPSCPTKEVARWMAAANLVTLPSYNEGCPNVILEALASGRPVVATDVGGIPELVSDQVGKLVPPRDVPSLTAALDLVLSKPWDEGVIASQHSRTWQDVADDVAKVLLIAQGRRRTGPVQTS